jgi:hypothetical protein
VRKHQLSPSASILMSLALALGILVADIANISRVTVASAQTGSGSYVPVADATVYGGKIQAVDVLVDGVPTRAVFLRSIRVVDSVIYDDGSGADNGVLVSDGYTGVLVSDGLTGVLVSDGLTGVLVSDGNSLSEEGGGAGGPSVTGGVLEGENIKIEDGVIHGDDLRVVGATVQGGSYSQN